MKYESSIYFENIAVFAIRESVKSLNERIQRENIKGEGTKRELGRT